jgi:hypothetical protein
MSLLDATYVAYVGVRQGMHAFICFPSVIRCVIMILCHMQTHVSGHSDEMHGVQSHAYVCGEAPSDVNTIRQQ